MDSTSTTTDDIFKLIENFNPTYYAPTRNLIDGNVSELSPYISRGVISGKFIYDFLNKNYPKKILEKFFQEMLWREYFQRLLQCFPDLNNVAVKPLQEDVVFNGMPMAILNSSTGITEIDSATNLLYSKGHLHNHLRLYLASICCNIAKSRFSVPAKWMYYHLLDADAASNFGSWQWVSGNLTGKKYFANQANINFHCNSSQTKTFLDFEPEELKRMEVPEILRDRTIPVLETYLPETQIPNLRNHTVLLYTIYNLDPLWHNGMLCDRILLFEPSHFEKYPVSEKVLDFVCKLADNIPDIIIYCGEFSDLAKAYPNKKFIVKEHPLFQYKNATVEEREWIVPQVAGFYPSFSKYYAECLKYISYG